MYIKLYLFVFCYISSAYAPPVRNKPDDNKNDLNFKDLHYNQYLMQVLKELESDPDFASRIKSAADHNRTEHISQSLAFVNHNIRNKLDEIKRKEVMRLNALEKELERKKHEARGDHVPPPSADLSNILNSDHLDSTNPHSFEIADLEKLITKTEDDLKMIDDSQEKDYKAHEMKKEHLRKQKLKEAKTAEDRKKLEKEFEESQKRHKQHPKMHHPGNEEQLKEVWEKKDHLDKSEFNPIAFFDMHDMNSDGHLDINEVEALMQNELQKVYEPNNTDDDMQERYHEMMRMRQEMMKMMDKNKDNLVSREEFLLYSKSPSFKEDSEWKTNEELPNKPFTDEEFNGFENDYAHGNDDDDDDYFSDVDESLRPLPVHDQAPPQTVSPEHVPPPQPINEAPPQPPHKPNQL